MSLALPTPAEAAPNSIPTQALAETGGAGRAFDALYVARPRPWLAAILLGYLLVASSFALQTPAWQAPDEPAQYSYIAQIAATGALPVLQADDYNQWWLEYMVQERFPRKFNPSMFSYEDYQPPLYYMLATPVHWLTGGSLAALRLFNVFLGAVTLALIYLALHTVFPTKPLIALGATAFAAFLPMRAALAGAVTNDGLAELLLAAAILVLLRWMAGQYYSPARPAGDDQTRLLVLGLLIGLGMLTKIYAYSLLPIAGLVVILVTAAQPRVHLPRRPFAWSRLRQGFANALWILLPALIVNLPMWVRNSLLYGPSDILGLRRHDAVVTGQLTTAEFIREHGWMEYGERAFSFTFQSFWGVFGWLGVFMDERLYTTFLIFSGIIFTGLLWATVRMISGPPDTDMDRYQTAVLGLFVLIALAAVATYIWYNAKFVQHQGRYLFWSMLAISTFVALGWREVLHPLQGWISGFLAAVLAAAVAFTGHLNGAMAKWTVLTIGLTALVLLTQPFLLATEDVYRRSLPPKAQAVLRRPWVRHTARGLRLLVWALPFALLFVLNLAIPGLYLRPQLGG